VFVCIAGIPQARSQGIINADQERHDFLDLFDAFRIQPTQNQLYLGMFTYHLDPKSLGTRNWNQDLVGFQYRDFFACTFRNSFYNRAWAFGWARNIYTREVSNEWDMALGYRLGFLHGYKGDEAPFSDISPIIPMVEAYSQFVYQQHYGMEVMLTSSISVSFFYQF
jgi:hypothetical protein